MAPIGFRVLKNIEEIVRQNQDSIGCNEMLMSTIQSSELWKKVVDILITVKKC